jgi:DNA processing protein
MCGISARSKPLLFDEKELGQVEGSTEGELRALRDRDLKKASDIAGRCDALGVRPLCLQDAAYPERLRNIYISAACALCKGNAAECGRICLHRRRRHKRASGYGLQTAERIGRELAEGGAVLVTGIAEGIDTAAAKGALKARGRVIAVLGTGVDVAYPAWNFRLQNAVAKAGALVSEYPPGTRAIENKLPPAQPDYKRPFRRRCDNTGPEKSGALITAARAQEQGRDIFAVPGNVDDESFSGSNALIRDGPAS